MSMKLAVLIGFALAVVVIVVTELLDTPSYSGLVFFAVFGAAWLLYCKVYVRLRYAHLVRKQLMKSVDPAAGAPAGAQPADNEVVRRMATASGWESILPLLADDFRAVDARGRRHKREIFRRLTEMTNAAYVRVDNTLEELLADPHEPGVFHARERSTGDARRGPALDCTQWTRYVLTPCGTQVREMSCTAVVSVA